MKGENFREAPLCFMKAYIVKTEHISAASSDPSPTLPSSVWWAEKGKEWRWLRCAFYA